MLLIFSGGYTRFVRDASGFLRLPCARQWCPSPTSLARRVVCSAPASFAPASPPLPPPHTHTHSPTLSPLSSPRPRRVRRLVCRPGDAPPRVPACRTRIRSQQCVCVSAAAADPDCGLLRVAVGPCAPPPCPHSASVCSAGAWTCFVCALVFVCVCARACVCVCVCVCVLGRVCSATQLMSVSLAMSAA